MPMPPSRQSPAPPGAPRRRPGPMMPSGWVWLVILGMALAMLWVTSVFQSDTTIQYSDFLTLLDKDFVARVTIVGKDHLTGELQAKAMEDPLVKELKIRGSRFSVTLPAGDFKLDLDARLQKAGVKYSFEEERAPWLSTFLLMLLPALLLLALFFFFFLPRLRDPLGGSFLSNYI